jgi:hypothetical protein
MSNLTKKNNYKKLVYPTDSARSNKPINVAGNSILIFSSPVNIDIKIHNENNDTVTLKQFESMVEKDGFEKFYISHSALAGGSITIVVYTDDNMFISLAGRTNAAGAAATTIGEDSLTLTLASTEYSKALTDSIKRLKLINTSVDAIFYISFLSGNSANGIPLQPLQTHNIESIDLESYNMYVQSDVASRTLNYMEFL